MNKSILFAFFILIITIGWLGSGQLGQVNAQDEKETANSSNIEINTENEINENDKTNIIKVETKIFNAEQIDQSIILQGQTIYNKKIDVKSEITGTITDIKFNDGKMYVVSLSSGTIYEIFLDVDK